VCVCGGGQGIGRKRQTWQKPPKKLVWKPWQKYTEKGGCTINATGAALVHVAGYCAHGTEPFDFIQATFDKLSDYRLLKKASTPYVRSAAGT